MIGKDTSYEIFINVSAERLVDLLRDPWTAEPWIASFTLDDGLDEFGGRTFRLWLSSSNRGMQQPVLTLFEQVMKSQQRRWSSRHQVP